MKLTKGNGLLYEQMGIFPHTLTFSSIDVHISSFKVELYSNNGILLDSLLELNSGDAVFYRDVLKITAIPTDGYTMEITINGTALTFTDNVAYYTVELYDSPTIAGTAEVI